MSQAKRIVLAARPVGEPKSSISASRNCQSRRRRAGEVLLRTIWLSLDPYMRGRMSDAPSYASPVAIGGVMEGEHGQRGRRLEHPDFAKGDIVLSPYRLADRTRSRTARAWSKIDPRLAPISTVARRARHARHDRLHGPARHRPAARRARPSSLPAASGAVGSAVGQIAKIKGARAVGIAGGPDKCRLRGGGARLRRLPRSSRSPISPAKLKAACPKGIDVYFENVGGAVFEAVFPLLNPFARVPVCGLIAHYNDTEAKPPKCGRRDDARDR